MKSFKALLLLLCLALLLITSPLFSADYRIWDPKDGLPLRQGYHIEFYRSIDADDNGNSIVVWTDSRSGDRELYAQLISSDGSYLWGDEGKIIISNPGHQRYPAVCYAGNGNWIVAWVDYRDDIYGDEYGDIYIQKLDASGNPLWSPSSGVLVCNNDERQKNISVFSDNSGGVTILWEDERTGDTDLFTQKYDSIGNALWQDNGICIADSPSPSGVYSYSANRYDDGSIAFTWTDFRSPIDPNVYCNKLSPAGDLLWADSTGMRVCANSTPQGYSKIATENSGGAFIVWLDSRNNESISYSIYGQYISSEGSITWGLDGQAVCNILGSQSDVRIVASQANSAIVSWEDGRIENGEKGIYIQKISNNNGSILFHWGPDGNEESGLLVMPSDESGFDPRITSDSNGGGYITWFDHPSTVEDAEYLFIQHIDENGQLNWGEDPILVSGNRSYKSRNIVRMINNNTVSVVWYDSYHHKPSIVNQLYTNNGNPVQEENGRLVITGLSGNASHPTVIQSTGSRCFVTWNESQYGVIPYMQRVNMHTGQLFEEINGVPINPGITFSGNDTLNVIAYDFQSVSDGNNGVLSVWVDRRNEYSYRVYAQKTDAAGNSLWGDTGTIVNDADPTGFNDQEEPYIIATSDGGAVVVYEQLNEGWYLEVRAQRLDHLGNIIWTDEDQDIRVSEAGNHDAVVTNLIRLDDGSILVIYRHHVELELYAQRILLTGDLAWDTPVLLRSSEDSNFARNISALKLESSILITWEDPRSDGYNTDIYCQMLSMDGSIEFEENGRPLIVEEGLQNNLKLLKDENFIWAVWADHRNNSNIHAYLQKYTFDLTPQFPEVNGIRVGPEDNHQTNPQIITDTSGGVYVLWEQSEPYDLWFTHLNSGGQPINSNYTQDGFPLVESIDNEHFPDFIPDGVGGFYAVWVNRQSYGKESYSNLYHQRVNDWTVSVENTPDVIPEGWSLENAYPNPFNPSTRIAFNVGKASNVTLTVYDILGREVIKLVDGRREVGNHIVNWNGTNAAGSNVASGTYFYRLEADDVMITNKMILLK